MDVQLFDHKGRWQEPDNAVLAALSDDDRALIDGVRSANENERTAADGVSQCKDRLAGFVSQLAAAENYQKEHFPPRTFIDEWRTMTGKV